MQSNNRLNYDIPRDLVPQVLFLAAAAGMPPRLWLRKKIEALVEAESTVKVSKF